MTKSTHIEIPGRPITWQRVGVCAGRFFDRQAKERKRYQMMLTSAYTDAPKNGPLALSCTFSFQMPKSFSKTKRRAFLGTSHEGRPDLDNLVKWVCDAANGILWEDDAQIVTFNEVRKMWGEADYTLITFGKDQIPHACPDWDFLKIAASDPEFACCSCPIPVDDECE